MAERIRVVLNHSAVARILKSAGVAAHVNAAAERVAANYNGQALTASSGGSRSEGTKVTADVEHSTTDRAVARVIVRHPAAVPIEARHGALARAASQAGYVIGRRK